MLKNICDVNMKTKLSMTKLTKSEKLTFIFNRYLLTVFHHLFHLLSRDECCFFLVLAFWSLNLNVKNLLHFPCFWVRRRFSVELMGLVKWRNLFSFSVEKYFSLEWRMRTTTNFRSSNSKVSNKLSKYGYLVRWLRLTYYILYPAPNLSSKFRFLPWDEQHWLDIGNLKV